MPVINEKIKIVFLVGLIIILIVLLVFNTTSSSNYSVATTVTALNANNNINSTTVDRPTSTSESTTVSSTTSSAVTPETTASSASSTSTTSSPSSSSASSTSSTSTSSASSTSSTSSPSTSASPAAEETKPPAPVYTLSSLASGTIIKSNDSDAIYEIIDGKKRYFSYDVWTQFGFPSNITILPQTEIDQIQSDGNVIAGGKNYYTNGACLGAGNWGDDKVYLWPCDDNLNKKWTLTSDGTFVNTQRQHCLATNSNSVLTTACDATQTNQKWNFSNNQISQGNLCLDSSLNMASCDASNISQIWNTK